MSRVLKVTIRDALHHSSTQEVTL